MLLTRVRRPRTPTPTGLTRYALTPRQRDVVECVARGLELKEIARALGIGYQTVKMHIRCAKIKMNARNQLEVVILAYGARPQAQADDPTPTYPTEQAPAWSNRGYWGTPLRPGHKR